MNIKTLKDIPPWQWPHNAGKMLLRALRDGQAHPSELLLAAELAGDSTVINDELVDALLSILCNPRESDLLRGQAAISLGPALEYADIEGFEDPDDVPITEPMFLKIQKTFQKLYMDAETPDAAWPHMASLLASEETEKAPRPSTKTQRHPNLYPRVG